MYRRVLQIRVKPVPNLRVSWGDFRADVVGIIEWNETVGEYRVELVPTGVTWETDFQKDATIEEFANKHGFTLVDQ